MRRRKNKLSHGISSKECVYVRIVFKWDVKCPYNKLKICVRCVLCYHNMVKNVIIFVMKKLEKKHIVKHEKFDWKSLQKTQDILKGRIPVFCKYFLVMDVFLL